jgi:hypothetical protein
MAEVPMDGWQSERPDSAAAFGLAGRGPAKMVSSSGRMLSESTLTPTFYFATRLIRMQP